MNKFQEELLTLVTNYGKLIQEGHIDAIEDSLALNELESIINRAVDVRALELACRHIHPQIDVDILMEGGKESLLETMRRRALFLLNKKEDNGHE